MNEATLMIDGPGARARVRTPGKHIVLFLIAVTLMLALSTSVIRSGRAVLSSLEAPAATKDGLFLGPAEEFLVDLAPDASGARSYLRLKAAIAYGAAADAEAATSAALQIREAVLAYLRALMPEDFEGEEDMRRLKSGLAHRARIAAPSLDAKDAVIVDIAIQ